MGCTTSTGIDAKKLFEEKCSTCHTLDRITSQRKTTAEWDSTTRRMQTNGASITEEEAKIIITYLANNYGK